MNFSNFKYFVDIISDKMNIQQQICLNFNRFLSSMVSIVRQYFQLFIDWVFGLYFEPKKQQLPRATNPLLFESAISIANKIKRRQIKSEEVVSFFIDRIRDVNPIINAVVDTRFDAAIAEARKIDKELEDNILTEADFDRKPFLGKSNLNDT